MFCKFPISNLLSIDALIEDDTDGPDIDFARDLRRRIHDERFRGQVPENPPIRKILFLKKIPVSAGELRGQLDVIVVSHRALHHFR